MAKSIGAPSAAETTSPCNENVFLGGAAATDRQKKAVIKSTINLHLSISENLLTNHNFCENIK